jgi:tungstate transport system substrate-binding protein
LLDVLVLLFEKQSGHAVKTISVGTGTGVGIGSQRRCECGSGSRAELEKQIRRRRQTPEPPFGHVQRFHYHRSQGDPAKIRSTKTATTALQAIGGAKANFVSRGDKSGTHTLERALWKAAGIAPKDSCYIEAGQGMAATLGIANERNAHHQ